MILSLYRKSKAIIHPLSALTDFVASGTKKVKYLEENMGALKVNLTDIEVNKIRDDISRVEIQGDRYPPFFAAYSFADTPVL